MRNIVSVIRHVPDAVREEYLETLSRLAERTRDVVKGFYLVESEEIPGRFQEFWEYASEETARGHWHRRSVEAETRDLVGRLEAVAPETDAEIHHWRQRL